MDNQEISYILSIISLVFYSIVYLPQFFAIFKAGSSEGISLWTILLWTQADILSLMGTLLLYMPSSIIIIGWYHYYVGVLMTIYILYYTKEKSSIYFKMKCLITFGFLAINTPICVLLNIHVKSSQDDIGAILGWITMVFYTGGRLPQIWMNYSNKSTGNLSVLMYTFTIIGNSIYIGVITVNPEYIVENIPWIVNGVFSIMLDLVVLAQYYYYNYKEIQNAKQLI
jgi:uncharacterized protein with PQ loop repeat